MISCVFLLTSHTLHQSRAFCWFLGWPGPRKNRIWTVRACFRFNNSNEPPRRCEEKVRVSRTPTRTDMFVCVYEHCWDPNEKGEGEKYVDVCKNMLSKTEGWNFTFPAWGQLYTNLIYTRALKLVLNSKGCMCH